MRSRRRLFVPDEIPFLIDDGVASRDVLARDDLLVLGGFRDPRGRDANSVGVGFLTQKLVTSGRIVGCRWGHSGADVVGERASGRRRGRLGPSLLVRLASVTVVARGKIRVFDRYRPFFIDVAGPG
jgi:hypothetical protein